MLFYIVYKKKIKKRFNFELNDKINEALAKYYSDDVKEEEEEKEEEQAEVVLENGNEMKEQLQPTENN